MTTGDEARDGTRWLPLTVAADYLGPVGPAWQRLIEEGRLFLGRAPNGRLLVHAGSLERLVMPLAGRDARPALERAIVDAPHPVDPAGLMVTLAVAAARARVSPKTLRAAVAAGALPARRLGLGGRSPYRVALADLDHWAATRRPDSGVLLERAKQVLGRGAASHPGPRRGPWSGRR